MGETKICYEFSAVFRKIYELPKPGTNHGAFLSVYTVELTININALIGLSIPVKKDKLERTLKLGIFHH